MFLIMLEGLQCNVTATCRATRVGRSTYYRWLDEDVEFAKNVEFVRESLIDFAEAQLVTNIGEQDQRAIEFFLRTQARHRGYGEKLEVSGPNGGPIPHLHGIASFPPEPETVAEWEKQVAEARRLRRKKNGWYDHQKSQLKLLALPEVAGPSSG